MAGIPEPAHRHGGSQGEQRQAYLPTHIPPAEKCLRESMVVCPIRRTTQDEGDQQCGDIAADEGRLVQQRIVYA